MTLSVIARRVGLSPGSTRRVLQTLVQLGFMGFKDQRYHLSANTLQLGYSYLSSLPVVSLIQPRLAELSEKLDEFCSSSCSTASIRSASRASPRGGSNATTWASARASPRTPPRRENCCSRK